jgi:O-antigen/teichoic acid export membrane protein
MAAGDVREPIEPGNAETGSPGRKLGPSLHRRLTVNSASNLTRYGVSFLVSFFLTPFVVRTLGDSVYGLWVVLLSFVGYAGILEMGVQPAVVKMVSQHRGDTDRNKLAELLGAAFVFFVSVGVLAALLFAFVLPPLLPFLAKKAPAALGSHLLFAVIALDLLVMFLNTFFTGVLYGWQLYPIKNLVDMASWVLNAALLLLFLERGGLLLLALAKTATDLGALIGTLIVIRRSVPRFRMVMRDAHRGALRELLGFGGRLFISATTTRVATYAQPLVVSSRISTAATTFFAIPVRLVDYAREITWSLAAGFMPAFSELAGRREEALLKSIYLRYSRYLIVVTLPIYVMLAVYGPAFIGLWIGPEYGRQAVWPLRFVAGAAILENLQPLYWRLFIGVGRLDFPVAVSAGASLLSIAAGFLLAPVLGLAGPASAIFATAFLAQIFYTVHAARYLETSPLKLLGAISARPLLAGFLVAVVMVGVKRVLGADNFLEIVLAAICCLCVYLPLALFLSVDGAERRWLRERVLPALRLVRLRP